MSTLDPYIVEQTSCRASLLVATAGFRSHDWEDLKQEMVLDLLRRTPKFNPARGDWRGFVRGVVKNHATVLATRRHRTARREILADDLPRKEATIENEPLEILDGLQRHEIEPALQMSLDIERVLSGLPYQLQRLARLLSELPVVEVCAKTGKSRSRVYQMTRQLRDAFVQAGFRSRALRKSAAGPMKQPAEGPAHTRHAGREVI